MLRIQFYCLSVIAAGCLVLASRAAAQPATAQPATKPTQTQAKESQTNQTPANSDPKVTAQFDAFKKALSGVKLVGHFTITGQELTDLKKEEYEIRGVSKLPTADLWLFQARIKYGPHDLTVPLPLEVKWAGATPIITLDNVTIPGLGTFGARVVIHDGKYAGTWSHGDVGGHLFGVIEKIEKAESEKSEKSEK